MKPEKLPDTEPIESVGMPHGDRVFAEPDESIQLEACLEHEWIAIKTRRSVYDVVVLSGNTGEVMVRGGRFFPEFRRATVTGSIFSAGVRLGRICVGMHLLLDDGERPVITSLIQTVSRPAHSITGANSMRPAPAV
jgi:hypothetical protein